MSFRLSDLKKSVRKTRDGYRVSPARLAERSDAYRIRFVLDQFEAHLGRPRRELDPDLILDFIGDARLGRGLLATLSQWYRMRPHTFAEVLDDAYPDGIGRARLAEHDLTSPLGLRAWLYAAVNRRGNGFLDPDAAGLFWSATARVLGIRREHLERLTLLDRPEEAILVRVGPVPSAADVMAAYNARAQTTLLRSAGEVTVRCAGPRSLVERAARSWAAPLDVEWSAEGSTIRLLGRADALGCWTRHGRRIERVVLELLSLPDLDVREVHGRLAVAERDCTFQWKDEHLEELGARSGAPSEYGLWDGIETLAAALRKERERLGEGDWTIRRPAHLVGVQGGVVMPHLELRRGDASLYLRVAGPEFAAFAVETLAPFLGKTPVALAARPEDEEEGFTLRFPGESAVRVQGSAIFDLLGERLHDWKGEPRAPSGESRRPLRAAA